MTAAETVERAICGLFVPGDRPERFDKAAATGAQVVIDPKDGIAPSARTQARERARRWLAGAAPAVAPSATELAWASRVLTAVGNGGVAVLDGQMVDRLVAERARRLLDRAAGISA